MQLLRFSRQSKIYTQSIQKYLISGLLVSNPADNPSKCEIKCKEFCLNIYYIGLASHVYVKGASFHTAEPAVTTPSRAEHIKVIGSQNFPLSGLCRDGHGGSCGTALEFPCMNKPRRCHA